MPRDNKRQRQSGESEKTSPAPSKPVTPLRTGEMAIDAFLESLRKEAQPTLAKSSKSYLRDFSTLKSKFDTYNKMKDDETFIPRSARINFAIKSDSKTSELETFKTLQDETTVIVNETKKKLRKKIIKSMQIEIDERTKRLLASFLDGLHLCAKIALAETASPAKYEVLATREAYAALTAQMEELSIFTGTELDNGIASKFPPDGATGTVPNKGMTRLRELFTALFLVPMRKWIESNEEKQIRDRLQSINTDLVKEATNSTIVAMETEESVSPEKLNDLIKEAVSKETAALRKEVERLKGKKQPASKKETRGRRSGASEKEMRSKSKNRNNSSRRRRVQFSEDAGQVDGQDNASSQSGGILRRSSYQNSRQKKKKQSNANSNRRRNGKQQQS